jgi:hypothetical protein
MLSLHQNDWMRLCECSLECERAPPSPPFYIHMSLQPNKERSDSALYSTLQPNKKWSGYVLLAKRKIEQFHSQKLEWSRSILVDSPTKRILSNSTAQPLSNFLSSLDHSGTLTIRSSTHAMSHSDTRPLKNFAHSVTRSPSYSKSQTLITQPLNYLMTRSLSAFTCNLDP